MPAILLDENSSNLSPRPSSAPRKVAVIGAGVSGVTATAHLVRYGLDVVLFERCAVAGGVWHYDPRPSAEPDFPNVHARALDDEIARVDWKQGSEAVFAAGRDDIPVLHAPPGPCYEKLTTNIPSSVMRSTLLSWPEGSPEHLDHLSVEGYINGIAKANNVEAVARYNTRVQDVVKLPGADVWSVTSTTLRQRGDGSHAISRKVEAFDAVVVAAGHYHEPHVPDIPGLDRWKSRFPDRVLHSKRFRNPLPFKDQNILLIGAAVSAMDIACHLDNHAGKIYRSSRGGKFDINVSKFPKKTQSVGEVQAFELQDNGNPLEGSLSHEQPVPGRVVFKDGTILEDVHAVIVATGYLTTYPFLSGLQSSTVDREHADEYVVITADASMVHNLHKDIFYIPDPTLAFVGVPFHCSTFSLFDFQGEVIARVLAGLASLPGKDVMREEYNRRKAERGLGRPFHSLLHDEVPYMDAILNWVNSGVDRGEVRPMSGVDAAWRVSYKKFHDTTLSGLLTAGEKV
ncbi:hypothetical protein NLU13_4084 [Sarocladium strictum]|uniref:Uncharacterized protein n=1 Tax=Sarocladium strictum TaxID=5046 RepID=A0AA39GJ10_SARSR|nr:hypothetical protein NLU13_4084 [Sarocladium strictum]